MEFLFFENKNIDANGKDFLCEYLLEKQIQIKINYICLVNL